MSLNEREMRVQECVRRDTLCSCIYSFPDIMLFVLTEYTHSSETINPRISNEMAQLAVEIGAYGIQAPGTRPHRITELRGIVGNKMKIISCGIGYQGTPYGVAVKSGADFEIVGRSIYQSNDPLNEVKIAYDAIHSR